MIAASHQINGPAAALVAETDFSFLLFGGAIVLLLFVVIVVSTILCRWLIIVIGLKWRL